MQGYNPEFHGRHLPVAQSSRTIHDRGSPGSDDDGLYLMYPDQHKMEPFYDDDPNTLTSQSLNADGTPKRPMNAFMIFARRRRPQVSAENQSLRTGEVSKILSREWNTMNMSDKQFYLDQAKQLKDSFNQKYPDYVYKRRPNNSRKRRKPDPAPGPSADHASGSELMEDYPGSAEYSDVSAVDVADTDDPRISEDDICYVSLPADPSDATYSTSPSRASSHQPPDMSYRPLGDTRTSYSSRPARATPDTGMGSSVSASRGSEHGPNYYLPYPVQQQHHTPSSTYFAESSSAGEPWLGARDDQSRMQMQSWSQNSHDLAGDDRHRGYPQPGSSHTWTNTSLSEGMSSVRSSGTPSATLDFPTLTAPFFPPQSSGSQEGFSSSSVQPVSVPSQHFSAVAPASGNPVSGRPYSSLQQAYGHTSSSVVSSYHQPQARTVSHSLSSAQSISSYTQVQTNPPPPAGSGGDPSQMHYWPRER